MSNVEELHKKWAKIGAIYSGVCAALSATCYTLYFSGALNNSSDMLRDSVAIAGGPFGVGAIMFGIDAGNEYRKYKKEKKYRLSKE